MTSTLISKIAAASIAVGALAVDKENKQQNYSYISADKILDKAGKALAKEGIVIMPSITQEDTVQVDYTDSYGKAKSRFDATIHFAMLVTDGETEKELPWRGKGTDYASPDKALYKAITSGHKYFLAKLLNIGVGNEDSEHEVADEPQPVNSNARQPNAVRPPSAQKAQSSTTPPQRTVDAATGEITSPDEDVDFYKNGDVPTDEQLQIMELWRGPMDAKEWAVREGYCKSPEHAEKSWIKVVQAAGGYSSKNKAQVFFCFLRHQLEKVEA